MSWTVFSVSARSWLPPALLRRIDMVGAIVPVDNATQPMQAAPVAAMNEPVLSRNAAKLVFAFTHFDQVGGDSLPTAAAKAQHVLASAENVLAAIGEDLGPFAERALHARLSNASVFLAKLDAKLEDTPEGQRMAKQLTQAAGHDRRDRRAPEARRFTPEL